MTTPDAPAPTTPGTATAAAGRPLTATQTLTVLDAPVGERIAATAGLQAGERFGPYLLRRLLGSGGMGMVFLADQVEPVQRPVALKLIRQTLAGGLAEAYFTIECQALAQMDHPGIARVYEAGRTQDGYPYLAMEWVDGQTLDAFLRERRPALDQRLESLAQIARAAHHAHTRRVIHRDLKPSNILVGTVDGRPQPKIIDFGIAVGMSAPGAAEPASYDRAGTKVYMSPEQAEGALLDARSDVYALGLIVLETLTEDGGRAVLEHLYADPERGRLDLLAALAQPARSDPAWGLRRWSPEWAAIVRRCLVDREQRYESAAALADDLERLREQRPLSVMPGTWSYRAGKFVRRHRLPVVLAGLALTALLGGLAAALYGLDQAEAQRRLAEAAAARAERQAERSERVAELFEAVLTGVDPERARDLDKTLMRSVLEHAGTLAEQSLKDDPQTLARIERTLYRAHYSLGEYERALAYAERAVASARRVLAADDPALLRYRVDLASAGLELSDLAEALAAAETVALEARRVLPPTSPVRLDAELTLAVAQHNAGQSEAALGTLEPLLPLVRELDPTLPATREILLRYGIAAGERGRFSAAEAVFEEYLARVEAAGGPHDPRLYPVLNSLGVVKLQQEQFAAAEPYLRRALALCEQHYGPEHLCVMTMVSNLAGCLRQQGKVAESGPFYRRTLEMTQARLGVEHQRTSVARINYANFLLDDGRPTEAAAWVRRALSEGGANLGSEHPVRAEAYTTLGRALTATGDYAAAERALLDSMELKRKLFPDGHRRLRQSAEALVTLYARRGDESQRRLWQGELERWAAPAEH